MCVQIKAWALGLAVEFEIASAWEMVNLDNESENGEGRCPLN